MFNNKKRTIKIEIDGGMSEGEMVEAFEQDKTAERWSIEVKVRNLYPLPRINIDRPTPDLSSFDGED